MCNVFLESVRGLHQGLHSFRPSGKPGTESAQDPCGTGEALSLGLTSQTPEGAWPDLNWPNWQDTGDTLHRWTQIVGKVRMALSPMVNHWWQVALYVNSRGLTTSPIPYGAGSFDVTFDFIDHVLLIESLGGDVGCRVPFRVLRPFTSLGIDVHVWTMPCEIPDAVPFQEDYSHAAYAAAAAQRFWHVVLQCHRVFAAFRSRFIGKASRFISSGAASTSRSRAFPDAGRRRIRVSRPISPTG